MQPNASYNEWFGHFLSKRKGSSSFFLFMSLREVTTFPLLLATSDYWVGSLPKSSFVVRTLIFSPVLKCLVRRRGGSGKVFSEKVQKRLRCEETERENRPLFQVSL